MALFSRRPALLCFTALVAWSGAIPTFAQTGAAEQTAPQNNDGDIIVTAQKREQSINNVGLTIQAATGDMLQERGIMGPMDLPKLVSGFSATQSIFATPVYTIRGVGLYDATFGAVPAVAVYTDQVPRNFPVMSDALDLDVERVEILKGPQGTVFGQSATGGAVNYITSKPTDHFAAGLNLGYERFGKLDASGFVSGPLTDTLRARLAVGVVEGGAWQYSLSRPKDQNGDMRVLKGRLSLEWEPSDRFKIEASASGVRDRSDSQAAQYAGTDLNVYSDAALAAANANPATRNPFGYVNNALYTGLTTPGSPNYDAGFLNHQAVVVGRLNTGDAAGIDASRAILSTPITRNPRAADWSPGFLSRAHNDYYQFTLRADYELSDVLTFTSLSAFAHKDLNYFTDVDGTRARVDDLQVFGDVRAFNQELRLTATTSRLNAIFGASYDYNKTNQFALYGLIDSSAASVFPDLPLLDNTFNRFGSKLRSYAVFGNVDYKLTDRLSVIAGGRFTQNNQSASYCNTDGSSDNAGNRTFSRLQDLFTGQSQPQILPGQCYALGDGLNGTTFGKATLTPFAPKLNENNFSYRFGLNYKFAQGTLLYATISQGYKAGVFSAIGAASTSQYIPAKQEKVINYEAGFKAPLFDRKLQLNGAFFFNAYSDKQVRGRALDTVFGLLEKMINVPRSRIWGLEGEIVLRPVDGLTLSGGATYLNSKVQSSVRATSDGLPIYNAQGYTGDLQGSVLPFTPKFSGNADIQYEAPMSGNLKGFVGASVYYQGAQETTFRTDVLQAGQYHIDAYETVDLRLGVASDDDRWRFTLYGRNIFNKYYITSITSYLDTRVRFAGRPSSYGATLSYKF